MQLKTPSEKSQQDHRSNIYDLPDQASDRFVEQTPILNNQPRTPADVIQLQRLYGNQATRRILEQNALIQRREDKDCIDCGNETSQAPVDETMGSPAIEQFAEIIQRAQASQKPPIQRDNGGGESAASKDEEDDSWIDYILPVGRGFQFEGDLGITPAIPIYISEGRLIYISRKSKDKIHILFRQEGKVAADTEIGAGIYFGGKKGVGAGADVGAYAQAGLGVIVIQEYTIPVDEIDDFLIAHGKQHLKDMIFDKLNPMNWIPGAGASDGLTAKKGMDLIGDSLRGKIGPYETRRRVEAVPYAKAGAEASIGLRDPKAGTQAGDTNVYKRGGSREKPHDLPKWRNEDGSLNAKYLINRFLSILINVGANAQMNVGFDQSFLPDGEGGQKQNLKIFIEGEASLSLPLFNSLPIPKGGGGGATFNVTITETPDGESKFENLTLDVYTKSGDLEVYSGPASQNNLRFNLEDMLPEEELKNLLLSGPSATSVTKLGIDAVKNAFQQAEIRQRYQLGGQLMPAFNSFLRRRGGAKSLISDTESWKKASFGVDVSSYLTATYLVEAPEMAEIWEKIKPTVTEGGKAAIDKTREDESLMSGIEVLQKYVTEFVASDDFEELEKIILDKTYISEAELRFEASGAIGASAHLGAGAKARGDFFVSAGTSCSHDFAQDFGGKITVRTFAEQMSDVLDNPMKYFPDCSIVKYLFNNYISGGGSSDGLPKDNAANGGSSADDEKGGGAPVGHSEAGDEGTTVTVVDPKAMDIDTSGMTNGSVTVADVSELGEGNFHVDVMYMEDNQTYYVDNIPFKLVDETDTMYVVELDSDKPIRISPEGAPIKKFISVGRRTSIRKSRFE